MYVPNTAKYLEYALKGVRLDIGSQDSATTSNTYLHLSNAFVQAGFVEEALRYIDKSLAYNPENPFSGYLKAYILYAKNRDIEQTRQLLVKELDKDTTRFDVVQEVGKICYSMRDYESAYRYYRRFIDMRDKQQLDIFQNADLTIAIVLAKKGLAKESNRFLNSFKEYADHDRTIYRHLQLSMYHCYRGDVQRAMEHLKLFSKEDHYLYWVILCDTDPVVDPVKDLPEFKQVMREIKAKFWRSHEALKAKLEEQGLL